MLPVSTLFIVGPTASGKSALALDFAEQVDGEIVNADAFQLYAGLQILTAKPAAADFARAPHHLYGVLPLTESCDAQRFRELALPIIQDIAQRGKVPIVVGGSGLYIKSLTHGLATLPQGDAAMREDLRQRPLDEKVAELLALDPAAASNVDLRNPRYVERALEICLLTGQAQSSLRQSFAQATPHIRGVNLTWDRADLCQRIDQRTLSMLQDGLIAEVAALGPLSLTAEKAIGIREVRAHLAGAASLAETAAAIQLATRQYAKRQTTWFRRESCFQTICLNSASPAASIVYRLSSISSSLPIRIDNRQ